jgi:very-short-patch-repair endonuclease
MSDTYPVVKIPPSISNAKPQEIERVAIVNRKSIQPAKNPQLVFRFRQIGYGLLFLSTLIFAVAVVRDVKIIPYSVISFCLGFAAVNMASLLDPSQMPTQQQTLKTIETIPVDYKLLLEGKVMQPSSKVATDAQKGVSEKHFEQYLTKYFGDILYPSYEFNLSGKYKYSSDFTLVLSNGISLIVEIDEPYNGKDKAPTHCTNADEDYNRDLFFVNGNWIVIRFSEFQVCAYPTECCYFIARTIDDLMQSSNRSGSLSWQFKGVDKLPMDYRWTSAQATHMAKADYRLGYLKQYKVYPNPHQKKIPYSGVKYSRK